MGTDEPSRKLSVQSILDKGPCDIYYDRLIERFTREGEINVTEELCVSQANDWDWHWAAGYLLMGSQQELFGKALTAADKVRDKFMGPLWALYRETSREAQQIWTDTRKVATDDVKDWYTARDTADATYQEHMAVISAAVIAACAVANKTYQESLARAFAQAFLSPVEDDEDQNEPTPDGWCALCHTVH